MFVYNPGDSMGPDKILFLKRLPKTNKREDYKGEFKCPRCGKTFVSRISSIATGNTKSCGCFRKETMSKIGKQNLGRKPPNAKFVVGSAIGPLKLKLLKIASPAKGGVRKGKFTCPFCKQNFVTNIYSVEKGHTFSCGCIKSKGEQKIAFVLQENNILFEKQKTYKDCLSVNKTLLRFDFYLPFFNVLIEYDGEQHFNYRANGYFTQEKIKGIQDRDEIKNLYCINNNIKLIRIPYTDFDLIDWDYLKERICL